jgi:hypothetical protein
MVVTGVGKTIQLAQQRAVARSGKVFIPNVRYRKDIGSRLIAQDFQRVQRLNLLDPPCFENKISAAASL